MVIKYKPCKSDGLLTQPTENSDGILMGGGGGQTMVLTSTWSSNGPPPFLFVMGLFFSCLFTLFICLKILAAME